MTNSRTDINNRQDILTNGEKGAENFDLNGLLPFLEWLDQRLIGAIAAIEAEETKTDIPYSGFIQPAPETLERLMKKEIGYSPLVDGGNSPVDAIAVRAGSKLDHLRQVFELSPTDLIILVIAIAPEIDRRYEKLYAYLQDDVRSKRPTVDLAVNLLGSTTPEKLKYCAHFTMDAPLVEWKIVNLVENLAISTFLARELHPDERIVHWLLDRPAEDRRLQSICTLIWSNPSTLPPDRQALLNFITHYQKSDRPLRLYFQGPDRKGKRRTAEAIAAALRMPLLVVDLACSLEEKKDFEMLLLRIVRKARLFGALLYFDDLDRLRNPEHSDVYQALGKAIAAYSGIVFLAGNQAYLPFAESSLGAIAIPFTLPNKSERREVWRQALTRRQIPIGENDLHALGDRFRLTAEQIEDAVATAENATQLAMMLISERENQDSKLFLSELFAAARSQAGQELAAFARKIKPKHGREAIVLPPERTQLLQELCQEAKLRAEVWESQGFAEKFSSGRGLNVLFSGPPGTGKTFAAEAIAHELELDLYRIDLSRMVSKYIGETEKNLDQVFTAAENSNAILLFDEADALFGKRSEVKDARDRYANLEISYLLQKMEEYEGIAILTTNFRGNLDEAFSRRLRYIIEFQLPGERERSRLWQEIWPVNTHRELDLDLEFLAIQFELSGANIRDIALRAAFLAAGEGKAIGMIHLIRALQREYQKMGKMLRLERLSDYARYL